MNVVEVATCVNVYKQVIETELFMRKVNEDFDNPWSDIQWANSGVGTSTGLVSKYRTSAEADITHLDAVDSAISAAFLPISDAILNKILPDYREQYIVSTSAYEGWRLLKYSGGGEYHAHYDHAPENQRIVSVVAFLESPQEGGHLEFPFFNAKIDPIAGDVVVFPSNFPYVHIAHPVVAGTKCSLVTWLR